MVKPTQHLAVSVAAGAGVWTVTANELYTNQATMVRFEVTEVTKQKEQGSEQE